MKYKELRDLVMEQNSIDVTRLMKDLAPMLVYEQNIRVAIANIEELVGRDDIRAEWQKIIKTLNEWKYKLQRGDRLQMESDYRMFKKTLDVIGIPYELEFEVNNQKLISIAGRDDKELLFMFTGDGAFWKVI